MYFLLSFFWFIKSTKLVLFYVYLWQLKEYQVKRFLDHFRTEKGKRLILVDDVYTTGSTLSEASRALYAAGAAKVACYTATRA